MKISTLLNVHEPNNIVLDTIDSIQCNLTKNILVLIDGAKKEDFEDFKFSTPSMIGFKHNCNRSPYRNVALGLKNIYELFPDSDWFCYTEYDVLFASPRILTQLKKADDANVWMIGNDGHVDQIYLPMIDSLIGERMNQSYYLLGCCQFFSKKFMEKLNEINFFEKFLTLTNEFTEGYMPHYSGYDISEHLYPTLARHFGGNIGVLASYDEMGQWHGSYQYYPVRWRPDIDPESENFPDASILHPIKTFDHPIRAHYRNVRKGI